MKTIIMSILLLINISAFAGPRIVGNGGVGIVIDNKVYMLDLYERGVHQNAYYNDTITSRSWVEDKLRRAFQLTNLSDVPLKKAAKKISEVLAQNYFAGSMVVKAIEALDWRLIDSELVTLEDTESPIAGNLVQIAVRQKNIVFINKNLWDKMDADNKLALIIHEAFYFWSQTDTLYTNEGRRYEKQSAPETRSITGLLFSPRFAFEGFRSKTFSFESNGLFEINDGYYSDFWQSPDVWLSTIVFYSEYAESTYHNTRKGIPYNKMNYPKVGLTLDETINKTCETFVNYVYKNKSPKKSIKLGIRGGERVLDSTTATYSTESQEEQMYFESIYISHVSLIEEQVLVGKNMENCKSEVANAYEKMFAKLTSNYSFENK
ncbi:MAG: hypothetical protein ACXVCN_19655 [Bdellovibrio sp.]